MLFSLSTKLIFSHWKYSWILLFFIEINNLSLWIPQSLYLSLPKFCSSKKCFARNIWIILLWFWEMRIQFSVLNRTRLCTGSYGGSNYYPNNMKIILMILPPNSSYKNNLKIIQKNFIESTKTRQSCARMHIQKLFGSIYVLIVF